MGEIEGKEKKIKKAGRAFKVNQTDLKVEWIQLNEVSSSLVGKINSFQLYQLDFNTERGRMNGGTAILDSIGQ